MRVLVVDDEPLIRRSLEKVFKKRGHEVFTSEDGESGLQEWRQTQPDVAIVDILMPGLTGPEMIGEIEPSLKKLVILISAFSGEYDPSSMQQMGVDLFIEKPFSDINQVASQIEELWKERIG